MDKFTGHIQEVLWCILFADDIISTVQTREGIISKVSRWRKTFKIYKILKVA